MLSWDYVYNDVKFVDEYLTRAQEDVVKCRAKIHSLAEQLMQKRRDLGPNDDGVVIKVQSLGFSTAPKMVSGGAMMTDTYRPPPIVRNIPSPAYATNTTNLKYTPITPINNPGDFGFRNNSPLPAPINNYTSPKINFDINKYHIDDKGMSSKMNNIISAQNNLTNLIGDISNTYGNKSATLDKCTSQTKDLQSKLMEVERAIDKLTRELKDMRPTVASSNINNDEFDYPVLDCNNHNDWYPDYGSIDPLINNFNKLREQLQKVQNAVQMADRKTTYSQGANSFSSFNPVPSPAPYATFDPKLINLTDSVRTLTQQADSALQASYQVITKMKCRENGSSTTTQPQSSTYENPHPKAILREERSSSHILSKPYQPVPSFRANSNPVNNLNNPYTQDMNTQSQKTSQQYDRFAPNDRPGYMPSQYLSEMRPAYSSSSKPRETSERQKSTIERSLRSSKTELIRKRLNQTLSQLSNATPSFVPEHRNDVNKNHSSRKSAHERNSINEKKKSESENSSKIQTSICIKESDSSSQSSEDIVSPTKIQPPLPSQNFPDDNTRLIQSLLKEARMYSLNDSNQPGPSYLPVVPIFFVENKMEDISAIQTSVNNSVIPNRDPDSIEHSKRHKKAKTKKTLQK